MTKANPPDALRAQVKALARDHISRGDPMGWYEPIYAAAAGDASKVPWADLEPMPWLARRLAKERGGATALVVGCGLADDVAAFAAAGFHAWGFDLSETALAWARQRFPGLRLVQADLFELRATAEVVWECYTIQALPPSLRSRALHAVAGLVAPGGELWISQRLRPDNSDAEGPPWPLSREELGELVACGLCLVSEETWPDDDFTRLAAVYARP